MADRSRGTDQLTASPVPAVDRGTDETARRLVAAAAEVFAEKGYDGAGVAEIARRAGLTTGAIYSRYSGKAELLAAAVQDAVPEQIEQLFAESCSAGHALEILRAVGDQLVTREPIGRTDLLLEASVAARRDPEVAAVVRDAIRARKDRWASLIEASKARGELTTGLDTEAIVHFAHAVGLGFLVYEAVGVDNPDPELWRTLIARVVSSLTPCPAADEPPDADPTGAPP